MNAWIVPSLIVIMGFAVLGVQWRLFFLLKQAVQNGNCTLAQELWRSTDKIEARIGHNSVALENHIVESRERHANTARITNTAMLTFENQAEAFSTNAEKLKVHAQELLDRAEVHGTNTRQVVTRG